MTYRALKALPLLLAFAAVPALASVKTGVEKWRAGDYKGAVTEWLPYAARGDADALFNLGQAYKLGRGVPANPATANDYFRKAAAKGHAGAQERLGLTLYASPATRAEGLNWLQQAAAKNQPRAMYVLGVAYFNGDGVQKNWPLAYSYMVRANNAGVQQAASALTTMNANIPPADRAKGQAMVDGTGAAPQLAATPAQPAAMAAVPAPASVKTAASTAIVTARPAAPATPPAPQTSAGWRVQLGAFSHREMANEAWVGIRQAQKSVVGSATPIFAQSGNVVRLQLGPYASRDEAKKMCARLTAAGRVCFVVGG